MSRKALSLEFVELKRIPRIAAYLHFSVTHCCWPEPRGGRNQY